MLAASDLAPLSDAERRLVGLVGDAQLADFSREPKKPEIRGTLLRELLLGSEFPDCPRFRGLPLPGLRVIGACITGGLNCADFARPGIGLPAVALEQCDLQGAVSLAGARLARLSIRNSRFSHLDLREAEIDGPFDFSGVGPLELDCLAWIDARDGLFRGQVSGTGARLFAPPARREPLKPGDKRYALWLLDAEIHGSLILVDLLAEGGVSIGSAHIRGNVWLRGARLRAVEDDALNADNARVGGSLIADRGFATVGQIWLPGAHFGNHVQLDATTMTAAAKRGGRALIAWNASIGTALQMRDARVCGQVDLAGARIGGELDCTRVRIDPRAAHDRPLPGFAAVGVKVRGNATFTAASILGGLDLTGADIDGKLIFSGATLSNCDEERGEAKALALANANVGEDVIFNRNGGHHHGDAFAKGQIDFTALTIGGDLQIENCLLNNLTDNGHGIAMLARGIRVAGGVLLGPGCIAVGEVNLSAAQVGRDFRCEGAKFYNPAKSAIYARDLRIGSNVLFQGAVAHGNVRLGRLEVAGSVRWDRREDRAAEPIVSPGLTISSEDSPGGRSRLDLRMAQIGTALHAQSLELCGHVRCSFEGARVAQLQFWWPEGWGGALTTERPRTFNLDGLRYDRFVFQKRSAAHAHVEWRAAAEWLRYHTRGERDSRFSPQPYRQLANVLRAQGDEHASRRISISERQRTPRSWWAWPFWKVYGVLFGYGYKPGAALLTLLVWIAVGTGFVWLANAAGVLKQSVVVASTVVSDSALHVLPPAARTPTPGVHELPCEEAALDIYDDVVFAIDMMLPFIPLHQENRCEMSSGEEMATHRAGGTPWRIVVWRGGRAVYTIVGWIFVSLALVTFSGVVKRIEAQEAG